MSLAGTLEELPLADILQIISLGRRTGILTLLTADGRFTMSFRDGLVVGATEAQGRPLGQVLIDSGFITAAQLAAALDLQISGDWKPLGAILVQQGVIIYDQLEDVARRELERITRRIVQLQKGNFSFQVAEVPTYGSCRLNAQEMLLETARQHDELRHHQALHSTSDPHPRKGYILIINPHGELVLPLRHALANLEVEVHAVSNLAPEALVAGFDELVHSGLPALVIADLEEISPQPGGEPKLAWKCLKDIGERSITLITAEYPAQVTQAMLDALNPLRILSRPTVRNLQGSISPHAQSQLTAFVEHIKTVVAQLTSASLFESMHPDAADFFSDVGIPIVLPERQDEGSEKRLLELLHESISQLKNPDETTEVSLLLMRLLAECFDRALFFLVRGDQLIGRGGFGFSAAAEKATAKVRKLRIPLAESDTFGQVCAQGKPFRGNLNPHWWVKHIPVEVGECPSREIVIYPLQTQGGTIGLVYADNSIHHKPLSNTHVLEIFLFQAGIALENRNLQQRLMGRSAS